MFTGIITAMGKVREPQKLGDGVRLTIDTPAAVMTHRVVLQHG